MKRTAQPTRDAVSPAIASTDRRHVEAANQILLDAARLLATSLELEDTLGQVMTLVVPRLADYALLYLRNDDGAYRQAASAHVEPEKAALLEELGRRYTPDTSNPASAVGTALATRRPVLTPVASYEEARRVSSDRQTLRILRNLAPVSRLVIPLITHGELLGSLVLITSVSGRRYGEADLALAELVGARAALAIENARLYRQTRDARYRELKSAQLESQLARARLEALRAQLNPHFLFNALNVVAMLVRRGANDDALHAVVSLSELLRHVLAAGAAEVPLRDEVALVERYLGVEAIRFRDRLSVAISVPPALLDARVPGLILQPLVENAIKHGIAQGDGPGSIEIAARHEGRRVVLRVADDGPGFPKDWDPTRSKGVGLANARERLERMYDGDYELRLLRGPNGGAVVEIAIPYRAESTGPNR